MGYTRKWQGIFDEVDEIDYKNKSKRLHKLDHGLSMATIRFHNMFRGLHTGSKCNNSLTEHFGRDSLCEAMK